MDAAVAKCTKSMAVGSRLLTASSGRDKITVKCLGIVEDAERDAAALPAVSVAVSGMATLALTACHPWTAWCLSMTAAAACPAGHRTNTTRWRARKESIPSTYKARDLKDGTRPCVG